MQVDSSPVMRRLFLALALVALLWSGVVGSMVHHAAAAADAEHAALHLESVGHHHHDDGGYHADDTLASVVHVALDASHSPLGIGASVQRFAFPASGAPPPVFLSASFPSPHLPPLLRPPRQHV
jgi:hypothetical protein